MSDRHGAGTNNTSAGEVNGHRAMDRTTNGSVTDVTAIVPTWAWKFIARLAKLEHGQVYTVTLFMTDGEPVWTVQPIGRVENGK